ncbi:FecCD family ABC transporter permease [Brachybacterium subflavum]|uniref:FecCD family ABC transporter permease n=1 Tax=Brachybacterium subflavum TaxID=2585206 RepID=UPI00126644B0|nr:iron ABC transporter permease [Brachybacterium subflavum]
MTRLEAPGTTAQHPGAQRPGASGPAAAPDPPATAGPTTAPGRAAPSDPLATPDPPATRDADPLGAARRARRARLWTLALAAATLVSIVVCLGIGPVAIPPLRAAEIVLAHLGLPVDPHATPAQDSIIWAVRTPRVVLGAGVGACLAVCGAALQAMVRNLLADPYVLGISGGASAGAAAAILFGAGGMLGAAAQPVLAFAGAMIAALAVLVLARAHGAVTSLRMLLAGIAVGYVLSAVTNLLIFTSDSAEGSRSVMFWMLGSLALGHWDAFLALVLLAGVLGTLLLTVLGPVLDALAAGDETAWSLGIHPDRARVGLLAVVSLCTGAAVSAAGAIGFVGLVIPHLARRLVGGVHRRMLPVTALLGALFLIWADAIARIALAPRELPIGVLTALVGAPFLVVLVRRLHTRGL